MRSRRTGWSGAAVTAGLLGFVLLLSALAPHATPLAPAPSSTVTNSPRSAADVVTATVTFQGQPVADHSTPGSAIPTSFGSTFVTVFVWKSPGVATLITQGTLSVLFLGATLGSSSEQFSGAVPNVTGQFALTSTQFQQDRYLFEGIYEMRATLFDQGQALWNTTFYVWVQAPDHLTVINVALILIAAFEIYQIAALGSARIARKQLGLAKTSDSGEVN